MKTIDEDIKTRQFKRVYLLYGQERYLLKQYLTKLTKGIVDSDDTMNYASFEGKSINIKEIIDLAETLPFFAERRLIVIRDSGLFKSAGEELAEYILTAPTTTFFLFEEEEIDKRSKLYKAVTKMGSAVEFSTQSDEMLKRLILSRLKRENKNITQSAYQLFVSKVGTDMANIDRELEKLICYAIDRDAITKDDVEAITTEQTQNKVFEMVEAIALHQQKKALDLYYDLLALQEPSMRIMYLITRQFHMLLMVKAMSNQGFHNKDIAKQLGCPEWAVRKYQSQCRSFTVDKLKQAVREGTEYEEMVKTGQMNDQMATELFIVALSRS